MKRRTLHLVPSSKHGGSRCSAERATFLAIGGDVSLFQRAYLFSITRGGRDGEEQEGRSTCMAGLDARCLFLSLSWEVLWVRTFCVAFWAQPPMRHPCQPQLTGAGAVVFQGLQGEEGNKPPKHYAWYLTTMVPLTK